MNTKTIKDQIQNLEIPYPEKNFLDLEINSDPRPLSFSDEDLSDLYQIHNTVIYKFLGKLDKTWRHRVERLSISFPLFVLIAYFAKEKFMFEFIKEGGAAMLVILLIGLPLLFRELLSFGRLILVKDHRKENLRIDTSSVIIGCLALFCFGAGGTGLGMYYSVKAGLASGASSVIIMTGFKEALGNVILSAAFASIILLTHYTCRRLLLRWHTPLVD